MRISAVSMWLVEVPQIEPIAPYRSHIRTSSTTTKAITRIDTDEGLCGWGECNLNFLPGLDLARITSECARI